MTVHDDVLYTWDVEQAHECGVTGDRGKAFGYVNDALLAAPAGASGEIHRVQVSLSGLLDYRDMGPVAFARRDEASGAVVWADRSTWVR